jgi:hypothetical protein
MLKRPEGRAPHDIASTVAKQIQNRLKPRSQRRSVINPLHSEAKEPVRFLEGANARADAREFMVP